MRRLMNNTNVLVGNKRERLVKAVLGRCGVNVLSSYCEYSEFIAQGMNDNSRRYYDV